VGLVLVEYDQERARDASTPEPILSFMNTQLSAVFPDVSAAAYVWPTASTNGSFDWEQLDILSLCHHAQRIFASDEHSNSYKLSYLKAAVDLIQQSAETQNNKQG
jgi:hypothetical protein